MFSYVSLEERVPQEHPLRGLVDVILANMSRLFDEVYSHTGRPSIPPEHLLRALLVQVLFTVRSERQLMEQLDYNLLFRWFVGLGMDAPVWDRTVFSLNRDRLLCTEMAREFFQRVLQLAEWQGFVSDEHFSTDSSMIEAWASHKSFVKKDGSSPGRPLGRGARQDSCRLIHAINRFLSSAWRWSRMTALRSGLSVTAAIGDQSRVRPDQRAGWRSRAWR